MKNIDELLKQEPVYLNNWAEGKKFNLISDFEGIGISQKQYEAIEAPYWEDAWLRDKKEMQKALKEYESYNILFASYGDGHSCGDAFVLYERNGRLYEVNADHCSSSFLKGQWDKEQVVLDELKNRLEKGDFGTETFFGNKFADELKSFLGL